MTSVPNYKDLQSDLASRGLTYCPITESEYYEVIYFGLGFEGAVSVALDVNSGFKFDSACIAAIESLIKESDNGIS